MTSWGKHDEPQPGALDTPIRLGKTGLRLTKRGEMVLIFLALLILLGALAVIGSVESPS